MLEKILKAEYKAELIVAGAFFIIMLIMTSVNVFSRYVLSKSFAFAEEISYLGFAWSTFIGMSHCFRTRSLVAIDVFVNHMPKGLQKVTAVIVDIILLITNIGLLYLSMKITVSGWTRRSTSLGIPYTFYYLPVLIVCVLMLLTTVAFLVQHMKKTGEGEEEAL